METTPHPLGQPLPSSGSRGRPLREPCGSPPSSVLWVSTTAPDPSVTPPVDPWGHVPPLMRRKSGALFGSWAIPVEHALDRNGRRLNPSQEQTAHAGFCLPL